MGYQWNRYYVSENGFPVDLPAYPSFNPSLNSINDTVINGKQVSQWNKMVIYSVRNLTNGLKIIEQGIFNGDPNTVMDTVYVTNFSDTTLGLLKCYKINLHFMPYHTNAVWYSYQDQTKTYQ